MRFTTVRGTLGEDLGFCFFFSLDHHDAEIYAKSPTQNQFRRTCFQGCLPSQDVFRNRRPRVLWDVDTITLFGLD